MLVLGKMYLFAMQNGNYCEFCLAVNGFYITFASEYIFYIKLVMDNVAVYKYKRVYSRYRERRVMII